MISELSILAHIKQCQVTNVLLRLTSCRYEPLVFNVYTLLAYTTHEEDLKAMPNPDQLLFIIIQSLKTTLHQKAEKKTQIEQLLESLKESAPDLRSNKKFLEKIPIISEDSNNKPLKKAADGLFLQS